MSQWAKHLINCTIILQFRNIITCSNGPFYKLRCYSSTEVLELVSSLQQYTIMVHSERTVINPTIAPCMHNRWTLAHLSQQHRTYGNTQLCMFRRSKTQNPNNILRTETCKHAHTVTQAYCIAFKSSAKRSFSLFSASSTKYKMVILDHRSYSLFNSMYTRSLKYSKAECCHTVGTYQTTSLGTLTLLATGILEGLCLYRGFSKLGLKAT